MVESRLKGETASFLIGKLRSSAATGELDANMLEDGNRTRGNRIAWVSETHRGWYAVLLATVVDRLHLFGKIHNGFVGYSHMVPRVVADLEAVLVQLSDFFPGHVIPFVRD